MRYSNCIFWFCRIVNKTDVKQDNVRIMYHWGAFMQLLLQ